MYMGENCKKCWCSDCGYLDYCAINEGNTRYSCENFCKGIECWMENCSQYIPPQKDTDIK